jgi:predicted DNA-binding transcriptional regulator AlpA
MATSIITRDKKRSHSSARIPPAHTNTATETPSLYDEIVAAQQPSSYPGNDVAVAEILPPESIGRSAHRSQGPPQQLSTKPTRLGESLVSKRELARFLGISLSGLDKLIARGRVPPFVKVGRLLKWHPSDVREWAARMQRETRIQHEDL